MSPSRRAPRALARLGLAGVRGLAGLLALAPVDARALSQPMHESVTVEACRAAGLPWIFCDSVGRAAYDTDSESWTDLSAHGQTADGSTLCDAAEATRERLARLGGRIHDGLAEGATSDERKRFGAVARDLGRALHTLEDTCAHAGMSNPQHAHLSDSDVCRGTHASPDVQPEAIECARGVAARALAEFSSSARSLVGDTGRLEHGDVSDWTQYPRLGEVCEFMQSAAAWDGIDRRWDNAKVLPRLERAFAAALDGLPIVPLPFCYGSDEEIRATPAPPVERASRDTCAITDAFCLATDVNRTDVPPPFYSPDGVAERAADTATAIQHMGCAAAGAPGEGALPSLALVLLTLVGARLVRRRGDGDDARG